MKIGEQLYWAERHAADMTIAEHNRNWFKLEAARMRAIGTKPAVPQDEA